MIEDLELLMLEIGGGMYATSVIHFLFLCFQCFGCVQVLDPGRH